MWSMKNVTCLKTINENNSSKILMATFYFILNFNYIFYFILWPRHNHVHRFCKFQPSAAYLKATIWKLSFQKHLVTDTIFYLGGKAFKTFKHGPLYTGEIPVVILMVCCLPLRSDGAFRRMSAQQDTVWKRLLRLITSLWMCCFAETHFLWP